MLFKDIIVKEWYSYVLCLFFFSSRRRHTRLQGDWSSDVCSSDLRIPSTSILFRRLKRGSCFPVLRFPNNRIELRVRERISVELRQSPCMLEKLPQQIGRASCRERV